MNTLHQHALDLAQEAEDEPLDERAAAAAEDAWDQWAEEAERLGVCLACEAPSTKTAYCNTHA